jgi:hypothetical protein
VLGYCCGQFQARDRDSIIVTVLARAHNRPLQKRFRHQIIALLPHFHTLQTKTAPHHPYRNKASGQQVLDRPTFGFRYTKLESDLRTEDREINGVAS